MPKINITEEKPEVIQETPVEAPAQLPAPEKPKLRLPSPKILSLLLVLTLVVSLAAVFVAKDPLSKEPEASNSTSNTANSSPVLGVEVALIEGLAEYSDNGETWQKLLTSTSLGEGKKLRTSSDGRLVLNIDDGSAVRLDKDTWVELVKLRSNEIRVTNLRGGVYARVVPLSSRSFLVASGADTYKALGTAFRTINTSTKKG